MPDLEGACVNDVGGRMDQGFLATLEDDGGYASSGQEQGKGAAGRTAAHDNNVIVGHRSALCPAVERAPTESAVRDASGVHLHPLSPESRQPQNQDETVKLPQSMARVDRSTKNASPGTRQACDARLALGATQ